MALIADFDDFSLKELPIKPQFGEFLVMPKKDYFVGMDFASLYPSSMTVHIKDSINVMEYITDRMYDSVGIPAKFFNDLNKIKKEYEK